MARQRPTPEEDLLNLIEKGDGAGAVKFKRKRGLFLSLSSLKNSWLSLGSRIDHGLAGLKSGLREPNLKVLNKVFLVISMGLLTYSIMDFVFRRPDIEEFYKKTRAVKAKRPQQELTPQARPFLYYLEMARRRNIFSPIVLKEDEKPEIKKEQLQEMAKSLSLVGISWAKEPMAMIEDKLEKKTYFLKKGATINKFKIENILRDKVILSFEGKEIELM